MNLPDGCNVYAEHFLVVFVRGELDGGVGHDPGHGGRVASPETKKSVVLISQFQEFRGSADSVTFFWKHFNNN